MEEKSPVFVKIDEYRKVLDTIDLLKKQLNDVRDTLQEIKSLRDEEEKGLLDWEKNITEAENKLILIDRTFFEPDE